MPKVYVDIRKGPMMYWDDADPTKYKMFGVPADTKFPHALPERFACIPEVLVVWQEGVGSMTVEKTYVPKYR